MKHPVAKELKHRAKVVRLRVPYEAVKHPVHYEVKTRLDVQPLDMLHLVPRPVPVYGKPHPATSPLELPPLQDLQLPEL